MSGAQFSSTLNNVDLSTGFSPFRFQQYSNVATAAPWYIYRSRGTDYYNTANVQAGDGISSISLLVQSNSTTVSVGGLASYVVSNDNAGNVAMYWDINAGGQGTNGYANGYINLNANVTNANNFSASGNISAANVSINTNGFMKLASYTASALTAITGQIGWMAAVSDSAGGSNPNGMIAFWDTTNSRWSYIHDNSAV